ncbi:MAG: extracellular solute-binding protein [Chloroflexaceae bacterium]|nr:extracellular solute-binding protein [Chloroflexaceae bacterium]
MRRLLLLLALLALLAGCAPAAPGPQPTVALAPTQARPPVDPASVVTITFGGIGRERQIFEPLIEAFNSANPDIQVQFVDINNLYKQSTPEIRSTRLVLRAVDTTYDNLTITEEDLNQGLVRDLRPLMEADPGFDQADFYPGTLAQSRIGEAMYMLPRVIIPPVFYYNKRLWNEAGLPPPNPNWPLSDMLDTAARLARTNGPAWWPTTSSKPSPAARW